MAGVGCGTPRRTIRFMPFQRFRIWFSPDGWCRVAISSRACHFFAIPEISPGESKMFQSGRNRAKALLCVSF
jgi:hypothetical protein